MKNSIQTPEESVQIINKMMQLTRTSIKENYWYYLFFGTLVIIASIGHLIFLKMGYPQGNAIWMLLVLGGIVTAIKSARDKSKNSVQSTQFGLIWLSAAFTYVTLVIGISKIGPEAMLLINPVVFSLAGGATFLSGTMMKFKAFIIGGIIMWLIAVAQLFFNIEIQLMLNIVAVIVGYLIPAIMLKRS